MKIDWAYLRKGWTSCKNAQEVLEREKTVLGEVVDARAVRLDAAAAWGLLEKATKITVAKGKAVTELNPKRDGKEAVLKLVMGPSGNLRAPTLRQGDAFVVGFHLDFYRQWLAGK